MMLLADATPPAPTAREVMARARTENFPVASRLLPARDREHLLAIYGFARLVDELGDSVPGDRLAALDWLGRELDAIYEPGARAREAEDGRDREVEDARDLEAEDARAREAEDGRDREAAGARGRAGEGRRGGEGAGPGHPLMRRLAATVHARSLPREPFARLIEANRTDQRVARYETWEQLRGYCALSADPVGELVLGVFGRATPERVALSDRIGTALQLAEHCQDAAEDYAAGRVYLPAEDLKRFGCPAEDLAAAHASPALRATLAFEAERGRRLLDEGAPLLAALRGRERVAVAAFLAGGRAAFDAIERAGYDVLAGPPKATHGQRLRALVATLAKRPARR
jgi:squalene synthase HpnC